MFVVRELVGATNVWIVLFDDKVIWYGKSQTEALEVARDACAKRHRRLHPELVG